MYCVFRLCQINYYHTMYGQSHYKQLEERSQVVVKPFESLPKKALTSCFLALIPALKRINITAYVCFGHISSEERGGIVSHTRFGTSLPIAIMFVSAYD